MVYSPLVRRCLPPIVDQLLAHDVIPGETVREIVESITGETLEHEEEATMVRVAAKRPDPDAPRISGDTPIAELVVCHQAIVRSEAGSCSEGMILTTDDPRVALAPECFSPLTDRLDALFKPHEGRFDR